MLQNTANTPFVKRKTETEQASENDEALFTKWIPGNKEATWASETKYLQKF